MHDIVIGGKRIGTGYPPFIIAEMSGNHNQSIERALEIVNTAAASGVHALKIQTYTADTMTLDLKNREFVINDQQSLWHGKSLYELYQQAYTPWEWHEAIFKRCRELGIIGFSTPFDETAVDFLESLDTPCYKIASFEMTDLVLLRKIARTGKPIIMSTGMATAAEIDESLRIVRDNGCRDIIILKCTSTYPATPDNSNISSIPHMRELFDCQVGLSDHTLGIGAALASVALGATVVEKHFTLCRDDGGVDAAFSLEPSEMRNLVDESARAWQSIGKISYGPTDKEQKSLMFRRSLYVVKDMKAGELITPDNVRAIRPGLGLSPKYLNIFLGKTIRKDAERGTPLSWDLL
ncbi:pseudaminic acid synthase [Dendrosporobacter sp. 1207_IL3150]|uniref:pseudaminic acid synthase n=1 Tax=Dendrosporobacter sp. 1207_IL3150 TaxID=3084054 RepID=UPI002FDAAE58